MIRFALLICVIAGPALADIRPIPRPDDLMERRESAPVPQGPAQVAVSGITDVERAAMAAQMNNQIAACWNVSGLPRAALEVTLDVAFENDETGHPMADTLRIARFEGGDQAAADLAFRAARRAIMRCGQAGFDLYPDAYAFWRAAIVRFPATEGQTR